MPGHDLTPEFLPVTMPDTITAGVPQIPYGIAPVLPALESLLPACGLPKGSITAVSHRARWLALALVAGISQAGSWCAFAGLPDLGILAAAETGLAIARTMVVPEPGRRWADVTADLLGACDAVILCPPAHVPAAARRRIETITRRSGAVLLTSGAWEGAPLQLHVAQQRWEGIGDGHGRLRARLAEVVTEGRGAASRPRRQWLWLPDAEGQIRAAEPPVTQPASRDAWREVSGG